MIAFKDFVPQQTQRPGYIKTAKFETVEQCVAAINAWVSAEAISVINIETVTVPDLWNGDTPQSGNGNLPSRGDVRGGWFQFIRVWYMAE